MCFSRYCCTKILLTPRNMEGRTINRSLRLSYPTRLSDCHPPFSMLYVIRAWWTSSTGEATSGCPPDVAAAAGWRDASQLLFALMAYLWPGFGFARAKSIPPRTTVIPLTLHPIALQWSGRTEGASIQQKKQGSQMMSIGEWAHYLRNFDFNRRISRKYTKLLF